MLASFYLQGTTPRAKDMLNNSQSEGPKSLPGILSGPHTFRGSSFRRTLITSASESWISESLGVVDGKKDAVITSRLAGLNTE